MTPPKNRTPESAANEPRELAASVHNVSHFFKSYQVRALTEVTFDVRRGEVAGLIGPSGSGKSTILKLLAGGLRPTEGTVKVFDHSPRRPSVRARINYLGEASADCGPTGWAGFIKRFLSAKQTGKNQPAPRPGPATSRRAQVAHALARNADFIVLDEPFTGLDPASLREAKEMIGSLARQGKTVILSSDSLSETRDCCDRVIILFDGKLQAAGTIDQLLATPDAIRFTAPVLPATLSDRVLKIIRDEIGGRAAAVASPPENRAGAVNPTSKVPQAEPAVTATLTESVLTTLLKTTAPTPAPAPELRKAAADPVNHRKLAELTKPVTDGASPPKPV